MRRSGREAEGATTGEAVIVAATPESELELLERAKRRDHFAFGVLMGRYQKKVFAFAYGFCQNREDAMEIVQETFLRMYEKLDLYRREYSLQSWIYRLAHNLCIDHYRRHKRRLRMVSNVDCWDGIDASLPESAEAEEDQSQMQALVQLQLGRLSDKQKTVFVLKHQQGMKLEEIAGVLGVSLGTVKTLHHRALQNIKKGVRRDIDRGG